MKQQQSARGIAQRISQWQLLGTMTGSALQRTFSDYPRRSSADDLVALNTLQCQSSVLVGRFRPVSACISDELLYAAADEMGNILVVDNCALHWKGIKSPEIVRSFTGHENAIFDLCWLPNRKSHICTGGGDPMLKIWDVETGEEVARLNGITKTVRSIRVNKECPDLLISGSRDGSIRLYDTRGGSASIREYSPAYGFSRSHDVSGSESRGRRRSVLIAQPCNYGVACVEFLNDRMICSAGATDGNIKFWDLRFEGVAATKQPICTIPCSRKEGKNKGITSLCLNSDGSRLYASCRDHGIYEYDTFQVADDCSPLAVYGASEFRIDSFYISLSLSPNQRWLTSTSGNSIYLFELNRPERPAFRIEGHSGEINNQNWSADSEQLASCADDGKIKFWQFDSDASECRQQQQWFQQTRTALEELGKVTEDEVDSETRQMNEKFTLARCTAPKIISSMPKQQQQLPFKQQNPTRKKKTVKRSKTTPTTAGQQQSRMRQENTTPNRTVRTLEFYGFGTASTTTSPPISSAAFVNNIT